MEPARYLECLAADASRLREVASRDLAARVPSCPDWSVADLVRHTSAVYLHKVETVCNNATPKEWPPPGHNEAEPIALFDRAYEALTKEFAAREPGDEIVTWYPPEQTVGFWIRRMAQETVIHRVDAELAMNETIADIPDDLAIDGIDEVLERFLAYILTTWSSEFTELLGGTDGRVVAVRAGSRAWHVKASGDGVHLVDGEDAATVSGDPGAVLLWLWRRAGNDTVTIDGDPGLVRKLWSLLEAATQ